jgi:hypothetical protein
MTRDKEPTPEVTKKVTEYVYNNYKQLKDKQLWINELDNCFQVVDHINGPPLILGKSIINQ